MTFKMCHINNYNNVAENLKWMTGIYLKKIELTKKHLNKEMVQSLQVPRNVYIWNITCLNTFR